MLTLAEGLDSLGSRAGQGNIVVPGGKGEWSEGQLDWKRSSRNEAARSRQAGDFSLFSAPSRRLLFSIIAPVGAPLPRLVASIPVEGSDSTHSRCGGIFLHIQPHARYR